MRGVPGKVLKQGAVDTALAEAEARGRKQTLRLCHDFGGVARRHRCGELSAEEYRVSVAIWREAMRRLLRSHALNRAAVRCGGFKSMTPEDYRWASGCHERQLQALDGLAQLALAAPSVLCSGKESAAGFASRAMSLLGMDGGAEDGKGTGLERTNFNVMQERDERGRWTGGSGASGGIHGYLRSGWLPEHDDDDFKVRGSATRYGTMRGVPLELARVFANEAVEHAAGYDRDGRQLYHVVGEKGAVNLPPRYNRQLRDGVVIHNHPDPPRSFSAGDLATASQLNPMHIMVVNKVGGKTVLTTLTRIRPFWNLPTKEHDIKEKINAFKQRSDIAYADQLTTAMINGDKELFHRMQTHEEYYQTMSAIDILSKEYGTFKLVEEVLA